LLFALSSFAFAQAPSFRRNDTTPRLGILPFSGGEGEDGETIAILFANGDDIRGAFTVVPRNSAVNALVAEQNFQMSGSTDSDTVARLGHMLNADFVVSGYIRRLGDRNLVITTIINVETFEQLAGDYRVFRTIEEIPDLLPEISHKMITASKRYTASLPKLAVAPFNIAAQGANAQDGETLAQILAVEITNTGKFAVLPRTTTMQAALNELEYQMSGYTAEEGAKALGRAINARVRAFSRDAQSGFAQYVYRPDTQC
jgi:TolB-like protein